MLPSPFWFQYFLPKKLANLNHPGRLWLGFWLFLQHDVQHAVFVGGLDVGGIYGLGEVEAALELKEAELPAGVLFAAVLGLGGLFFGGDGQLVFVHLHFKVFLGEAGGSHFEAVAVGRFDHIDGGAFLHGAVAEGNGEIVVEELVEHALKNGSGGDFSAGCWNKTDKVHNRGIFDF
jgi:hypothetical protein